MTNLDLKEAFLHLLREDAAFTREIRRLLVPDVATKDDLRDILSEIKQLREDSNQIEKEIHKLHTTLGALGDRWGRHFERLFLNSLREFFQE